jgi:hypothetical protein
MLVARLLYSISSASSARACDSSIISRGNFQASASFHDIGTERNSVKYGGNVAGSINPLRPNLVSQVLYTGGRKIHM